MSALGIRLDKWTPPKEMMGPPGKNVVINNTRTTGIGTTYATIIGATAWPFYLTGFSFLATTGGAGPASGGFIAYGAAGQEVAFCQFALGRGDNSPDAYQAFPYPLGPIPAGVRLAAKSLAACTGVSLHLHGYRADI